MTRPIQLDDLFRVRTVSDVRLSPSGDLVAVVVTRADRESNTNRREIWIVPSGGSHRPIPLAAEHSIWTPRWSPDGQWLLCLQEVDGVPQIAVMRAADGGDMHVLTEILGGASSPSWSPDGKTIAFLAAAPVGPDFGAAGITSDDPTHAVVVIDRLKHKLDGAGFHGGTRLHVWSVALDGTVAQLTSGDWDAGSPAWSPTGEHIAFTATVGPDSDRSLASDLFLVPTDGGEVRRLTDGVGFVALPSWSPDGCSLAYYRHDTPGAGEGGNAHVWVLDIEGTFHARDLMPNLDTTATAWMMTDASMMDPRPPEWLSDGNALLFHAAQAGAQPLFKVTLDGRRERLTLQDSVVDGFDTAGDVIVYTTTTPVFPGQVAITDTHGGPGHTIFDPNEDLLQELDLTPPEEIRYDAVDDLTIHAWYMPPLSRAERPPLVLNVHGGPHGLFGRAFVFEFQLLAAAGYGVLYVNPRGSVGYGQEFALACRHDWGGKDWDDLMRGVDLLTEGGMADPTRLGITGLSYGGFMTNWAVTQTDRFAAAVSYNGISNWESHFGSSDFGAFLEWEFGGTPWDSTLYRDRSPLAYVERAVTPLLLLHSEEDLRCPIVESEQMFVAYLALGKRAQFVRYPGESHMLSWDGSPVHKHDRLARTIDWFEQWMPAHREETV